ncbi:MAG: aminodeoxychorismate/anthranilate synthase component II [Spirochaetia bacterium]|nr:aminodeoxychorismate/anthranilate synthase component II [Spirochaetia bacterium]
MKKLLVIDNYDSFTFNLVQMFKLYDLEIHVYRNDKIELNTAAILNPDYILISPGPRTPDYSGISIPLINKFYRTVPILGVCLGMQCINELFGGKTVRAPVPVHGKKDEIYHEGVGIFKQMPKPFLAARYHSLIVERESSELVETAYSKEGIIMGIEHTNYPLFGIQFHPESFMTEDGFTMIDIFLSYGNTTNDK